jgi:hypothetical protein
LGSTVSHSAAFSIYHSYLPELTAYKIYRAVDASSLSPVWNLPEEQLLATNNKVISKQPDRPQHPLLDERLISAQVKAVVNGGENYKNREDFVSIDRVEGVLSL